MRIPAELAYNTWVTQRSMGDIIASSESLGAISFTDTQTIFKISEKGLQRFTVGNHYAEHHNGRD